MFSGSCLVCPLTNLLTSAIQTFIDQFLWTSMKIIPLEVSSKYFGCNQQLKHVNLWGVNKIRCLGDECLGSIRTGHFLFTYLFVLFSDTVCSSDYVHIYIYIVLRAFLDQLNSCQLFKEHTVPCSWLICSEHLKVLFILSCCQ